MIALGLTLALAAQHHAEGMAMPAPSAPAPSAPAAACSAEHAAMGHCTPPAAPPLSAAPPTAPACPPEHAAMGHCIPAAAPVITVPPPAPRVDYADRIWGADAMAASRARLYREHGGGTWSQLMVDIAEWQVRDGRDGYRWDATGWYGGDRDRLMVKTEGEGTRGTGVDDAEVQALYSRAIGPYFDVQGGVRQDVGQGARRTYATLGIEGLAPYWFDVEARAFVSTKGEVLARFEASYDQRITQRLILQPRAELNASAQRVAALGLGRGLTDFKLDARLRYEIQRSFAPYVGVSWDRRLGGTARLARAAGRDVGGVVLVAGVRGWF